MGAGALAGSPAPARRRRHTENATALFDTNRHSLEAVGHRVYTLERVAFGPLRLGSLQPGEFRKLGQPEVERLRSLG